jgi:hypothetical protein
LRTGGAIEGTRAPVRRGPAPVARAAADTGASSAAAFLAGRFMTASHSASEAEAQSGYRRVQGSV